MTPRPRVTVLIPARDARATIDECLDSVAAQTLAEHEVVLVDDGSEDGTRERVAARARRDSRIRLVPRARLGVVAAANEGLALAATRFIARLDADDRMRPQRLERQLSFLEAHPEVTLVGSRLRAFPETGVGAGMREYLRWQNGCLSAASLREEIYVEVTVSQPTFAFRADVVRAAGGWRDGDFPEDYELLLRLVHAGRPLGKCPEVLVDWRRHPGSLSRRDPRYARESFDRLRARFLARDARLADRPVAIWGAGRRTRRRADHLLARGVAPVAWVDIDPRKIGNRIGEAPVVAPDWLERGASVARPLVLVYVATHGARARIGAVLERAGYRQGRDWLNVG